ncbi:hypothetical protein CRE_09713 [Caenorhabditis remanei]|uniref:Protein kinase domain-containing protein n=1 Tax=Caenorhabditis remanei TaxID=31234 RepID=E3N4W9_CAERE|nr:hypothetical protein CRE_09713 [Caenorhabditis remanei]
MSHHNRSPTSPIPSDSPSTPPTPTSPSHRAPLNHSSDSQDSLSTPPIRSPPSPQFILDTSATEDESDFDEDNNMGVFEFSGRKYSLRKMLGEGSYGKVYLAVAESRRMFAVKFFKMQKGETQEDYGAAIGPEERILTLYFTLETLFKIFTHFDTSVHKNIAKITGIGFVDYAPDDCYRKVILMPLYGISLATMIAQSKDLDIENRRLNGLNEQPKVSFRIRDIQKLGSELLSGLEFLARYRVLHLDIKSENLLFMHHNAFHVEFSRERHSYIVPDHLDIVISDFGMAKLDKDVGPIAELVQTEIYRAPEVFVGCLPNNRSDIWSAGIIILELYTTVDDFESPIPDQQELRRFRNLQYALKDYMTPELWEEAARTEGGDAVRGNIKLFDNGPADRSAPRLSDLKRSHHADLLFAFLRDCLVLNWNRRPSARQLLLHDFFQKK